MQPTADDAPSRATRRDAVRNRELLLAAATEVLASEGIDAPLELIARRADVGIATLYRNFPSRDELLTAVLMEPLRAHVQAARDGLGEGDPWVGLCGYLRQWGDQRLPRWAQRRLGARRAGGVRPRRHDEGALSAHPTTLRPCQGRRCHPCRRAPSGSRSGDVGHQRGHPGCRRRRRPSVAAAPGDRARRSVRAGASEIAERPLSYLGLPGDQSQRFTDDHRGTASGAAGPTASGCMPSLRYESDLP